MMRRGSARGHDHSQAHDDNDERSLDHFASISTNEYRRSLQSGESVSGSQKVQANRLRENRFSRT
jgi:hypothetical protein